MNIYTLDCIWPQWSAVVSSKGNLLCHRSAVSWQLLQVKILKLSNHLQIVCLLSALRPMMFVIKTYSLHRVIFFVCERSGINNVPLSILLAVSVMEPTWITAQSPHTNKYGMTTISNRKQSKNVPHKVRCYSNDNVQIKYKGNDRSLRFRLPYKSISTRRSWPPRPPWLLKRNLSAGPYKY